MTLPRVVAAETLDELPPDDPAARRSRGDLRRIHLVMGTRGILRRALTTGPGRPQPVDPGGTLRILEIGAGDGTLMLGVARALGPSWPSVELTLLDREPVVAPATLAAYAALGWRVQVCRADVLDWATGAGSPSSAPGSPSPASAADASSPASAADATVAASASAPRLDLVLATLFLHHFEGDDLTRLLHAIAARAQRFVACEPRRSRPALVASHLVGALGANAVTREDAVLSVHAGFRGRELSERWPGRHADAPHRSHARGEDAAPARSHAGGEDAAPAWHLRETPAGLFSHLFDASRVGAARRAGRARGDR